MSRLNSRRLLCLNKRHLSCLRSVRATVCQKTPVLFQQQTFLVFEEQTSVLPQHVRGLFCSNITQCQMSQLFQYQNVEVSDQLSDLKWQT